MLYTVSRVLYNRLLALATKMSQGILQSFYSLKVLLKALKSLAHFLLQVRTEFVHTEHHFCSIHSPAYLSASLATKTSQEHLSYIYLPVACTLHVHVQHLQYLTPSRLYFTCTCTASTILDSRPPILYMYVYNIYII